MAKKPSKTLIALYGESFANEVFNRLEKLDPAFNELAQTVSYDMVWSRPGLSMKDRSMITIATLLALGKEEQSQIHMRGFLNLGGTESELREIILHLGIYAGFPAAMNGFATLDRITGASQQQGRQL